MNYPNPFSGKTTIIYELEWETDVLIHIFDIEGKTVKSYSYQNQAKGQHRFNWYAGDHPPGIYYFRIRGNGVNETGKMVLIR
ncbi:MAG: T9SS type A sorting domain-containing protein [Bacteroidales bacterium]|nr:T9SS type A sorting domain-containing protein [Bacteroidales bacterium]